MLKIAILKTPVPRFCIALDTSSSWETEIEIEDHPSGKLIPILVDYANLPIRCRYCSDLNHQISSCPQKQGNARQTKLDPRSSTKLAPQSPLEAPPQPEKPPVDADGFTMTSKNRKKDPHRAPPEFHSLKDTEKPAEAAEASGSHQAPTNELSTPPDAPDQPPTHPEPTRPIQNHHPAPQEPSAPPEMEARPQVNAANTPERPTPSPTSSPPANNNPCSSPQSGSRLGDPHTHDEGARPDSRRSPQMCYNMLPQLFHAPTQRLAAPTQPFLTFGLDLNATAESDDTISMGTYRANGSPSPTYSINRSRSRSRSRSPSKGKANSHTPRRSSSPKQSLRILQASLGTASHPSV